MGFYGRKFFDLSLSLHPYIFSLLSAFLTCHVLLNLYIFLEHVACKTISLEVTKKLKNKIRGKMEFLRENCQFI